MQMKWNGYNMGTFNFGEHATKNSYQLMGEDIDEKYIEELQKILEDEIDNISSSLSYIDELGMTFGVDEVLVEYGYYEGVRYIPNIMLVVDTIYIEEHTSISIDEDYLGEYQELCINKHTGGDYYDKTIDFLWDKFIISGVKNETKDKISKQIKKYFNEIDKILNKYLTPYTIGWCASEIAVESDIDEYLGSV